MSNNTPIKYILYARKSSEDKGKQILSLESQTNEMQNLANDLGLKIHKTYTESKSAKKPDNRPLFSEMIDIIKNKKDNERYGILCWKIDRLSRNPIDSATIQWILQQNQLKVIQTAERQYLPSDNVVLFSVESSMANQYILDLSKNVKRGQKTKLEKGDWPGLAPIGYLNDGKGGITVDRERAKYIKKAFELYATGTKSFKEIANILHADGFKTRGGNKYHKSKIHQTLMNHFYYGTMFAQSKKYLGNHKPIISKELFDKVQAVRDKKTHPRTRTHNFTYRGLMHCNVCNCNIIASLKKQKHTYYYCTNGKGICEQHKNYLKEDDINILMANLFKETLKFSTKIIDLCYKASLENSKENDDYLEIAQKNLEKQIKTLEEREKTLFDKLLDKLITDEDYKQKKTEIHNSITNLKGQIIKIKSKNTANRKITLERTRNLFIACNKGQKEFFNLNQEKKQKLANKLLWNVTLEDKKIASFSFKMPYQMVANTPKSNDFLLMRE